MGLFNKLKDVLFVEEEVEIPVIDKVVETKVEEPVPEEAPKKFDNTLPEFEETKKVPIIEDEKPKENINHFSNVKRDLDFDYGFDLDETDTQEINMEETKEVTQVENDSPFLSFDEEEFEKLNASIRKEEPKKPEYTPIRKEVVKEVPKEEKPVDIPKKFRLSPIISPVYGILDKNYKKEDIVEKADDFDLYEEVESAIDVDSVRKKAYGTLEDDIETTITSSEELPVKKEEVVAPVEEIAEISVEEDIVPQEEEVVEPTIEEPVVDIHVDDNVVEITEEEIDSNDIDSAIDEEDIIDNQVDEDEEPVLHDDVELDIPSFEEVSDQEDEEKVETPNDILEKTNALKILDDIEKELEDVTDTKIDKEAKDKEALLEDTTETDLFNLIDSMYDDKEED